MSELVVVARKMLCEGGYTCVMLSRGEEFTSFERGVKPLIEFLDGKHSFAGAVAADKCVGAGAAHLYVLLGVSAVWANIISASALEVLETNGIKAYYEKCVPYIINRKGDGVCPIESAVKDAKSSAEAYDLIIDALARLRVSGV